MQITAKRDLHLLQWKIIKKQPSVNALTYGDVAVALSALHRLMENVRSSPHLLLLIQTFPTWRRAVKRGQSSCFKLLLDISLDSASEAKTGSIFPI